ncbi:MAG: 7TM diverse intracellular signaling domain-containing protein [Bacteroidia bacterium]
MFRPLLIYAALFFPVVLFAQQRVVIDSLRQKITFPDSELSMAIDTNGELGLEDVIRQSEGFTSLPEGHEFESNTAYWFWFEIENQLDRASEWMFYVGKIGYADVYIRQEDGSFLHRRAGKYVPHSERDVNEGRSHKVRLEIPSSSTKTMYVRLLEVDHTNIRPVFQMLEMSYWKGLSDEVQHVIVAAFCGVLFIIMLYNFILFIVTKQSAHLYYALYLLFNGAFVLFVTDTLALIPTEHPRFFTHLGLISLGLISILYFQFGRAFVDTRKIMPKWDTWLRGFIIIKLAVVLFEVITLMTSFNVLLVNIIEFYFIMADIVVAILLTIRLARTKRVLSRFFIAGSACVIIFAFGMAVINNFIDIPDSFMYYLIGVVMEIIIFSLGLGWKIKNAEKEKLRSQEALNKQLMEADRLKDEFLANTSHELRTPLNGIIGLAESLQSGAGGPVSEKTKHDLGMIISSGRRLGSLVNDLLDFSKLKNFELELRRRPVEVHGLIDVVLEVSHPLLEGKEMNLIHEVPMDLPSSFIADESRLQQIFTQPDRQRDKIYG